LVLGADAREVLLLGLRDAELVPGVLDVRRQLVPGLRLLLGRADVVVDRVEVDSVQVAAPAGQRARLEVLERLEAELPHPVRLVLVLGDGFDDLLRQAAAGLEEVVLWSVESVLVLVADAGDGFCLGRGDYASPPSGRKAS